MVNFATKAQVCAALLTLVSAQDSLKQSPGIAGPLLNISHADPSVFRAADGTWYSFSNAQAVIQSTTSDIRGTWKSLPDLVVNWPNGRWPHGDIGAPQVNQLADKSYIMFFSAGPNGTVSGGANVGQCIGYARSQKLLGPYTADATPYGCSNSGKGTGPSAPAFFQQGGKNYFLYKSGYGWDPTGKTQIYIKEVAGDGTTDVSKPALIAEHDKGQQYLEIEGPQMTYNKGTYYAFYNLGVWCDKSYHIVWSSSKNALGPYTFGGEILSSGTTQGITLVAPGGTGFTTGDPNTMTFMAYVDYPDPKCGGSKADQQGLHRQLYTAKINYVDGKPTLATL